MTGTRSGTHTGPVIELLRVPLRCIGVVCPAAGVLWIVEMRGGVAEDGGFGAFFAAMALSLLAAAAWSASDARRGLTARVAIRWSASTVLVSGGLGVASTLLAPNGPPEERATELVSTALFYGIPLAVAVALGTAAGASAARERRAA